MYAVKIRDHIMIAHSLPHPGFGPAQHMHGATYLVDATFKTENLNEMNVAIDIGEAHQILKEVLAPLSYQNLDEIPQFKNQLTTTEFIAHHIFQEIKKRVLTNFSGQLLVTLGESHVAWASYEGNI